MGKNRWIVTRKQSLLCPNGFGYVIKLEEKELAAVGILYYPEDGGVFDEHIAVDVKVFVGGSIISGFWGSISVDYTASQLVRFQIIFHFTMG